MDPKGDSKPSNSFTNEGTFEPANDSAMETDEWNLIFNNTSL